MPIDMPPPNGGLPCRGGLRDLCLPRTRPTQAAPPLAFAEPGEDPWIDARRLEELMAADPDLAAACRRAIDRWPDRPGPRASPAALAEHEAAAARQLRAVERQVDRVFSDGLLVEILEKFAGVRRLVAHYMVARVAAAAVHPGRFPDQE